jgi:hypothetical protein
MTLLEMIKLSSGHVVVVNWTNYHTSKPIPAAKRNRPLSRYPLAARQLPSRDAMPISDDQWRFPYSVIRTH